MSENLSSAVGPHNEEMTLRSAPLLMGEAIFLFACREAERDADDKRSHLWAEVGGGFDAFTWGWHFRKTLKFHKRILVVIPFRAKSMVLKRYLCDLC